jgi:trehalose-phosphatase
MARLAAAPGLPEAELARLARVPRLLVASDYDGVLAPIVTDPAEAVPLPGVVEVLADLAALPGTAVAAVSGRGRADLAAVSGLPPEVLLVGGHGSEFGEDGPRLAPEQAQLRARVEAAVRELAAGRDGVRVEVKSASVVLHTRTADREVAASAAAAALAGPGTWPGVHATTGKEVVELSVVATHKGTAVEALRTRSGAGAVLFLGDDVTDENAFAALRDGDVGVKVGPGETAAGFRVPDPPAALDVLTRLRDLRSPPASARRGPLR